ncbi:MAG: hypothetical protein KUL82_00045 [Bdellovibrio sp.]|nr:hypothetical protein [Bdellovibrio sp.]
MMKKKSSLLGRIGILYVLSLPLWAGAINFNTNSMWRAASDFLGLYGDGSDGVLTISGIPNGPANPYQINTTSTYLTADAAANATSVTVSSAAGFAVGQEILIIQMVGADAGKYQFRTLTGVSGSVLSFSGGLSSAFASSNKVQVVRVMKYSNVTINSGGFLTVPSYSSATGTGGVLVMKVSGTLTINNGGGGLEGHVSVGGGYGTFVPRGFTGGVSGNGEGPLGGLAASNAGGGSSSPGSSDRLVMGSGGGSSAATGGRGGGVIFINANALVLNGGIRADGQTPSSGNAGGGAGGAVFLQTNSLTTSATCGQISSVKGNQAGTGTVGGDGRIFVNYKDTLGCTPGAPSNNTTYQKFYLK